MTPGEWMVVLYSFLLLLSLYMGNRTKAPNWLFLAGLMTIFFGLEIWALTSDVGTGSLDPLRIPLVIGWFGVGIFILLEGIAASLQISEGS
jgi:hypothetical protein